MKFITLANFFLLASSNLVETKENGKAEEAKKKIANFCFNSTMNLPVSNAARNGKYKEKR